MTTRTAEPSTASVRGLDVVAAAALPCEDVLRLLATLPAGLDEAEAGRRLAAEGSNALRSHRVRPLIVWRQMRSPLLLLLALTATVSAFLGERSDALVIGTILVVSIGLGFDDEFRPGPTDGDADEGFRGASPPNVTTRGLPRRLRRSEPTLRHGRPYLRSFVSHGRLA